jgi:hypothetical protein
VLRSKKRKPDAFPSTGSGQDLAARRTFNLGFEPESVVAAFNPKIRAPDNSIQECSMNSKDIQRYIALGRPIICALVTQW